MAQVCLHIMVVSASGLAKKDFFGMSDPYVKLTLKRGKKSLMTHQTRTKKKTLNPVWNERFVMDKVNPQEFSLVIEVFDEHRLTRDNFLGRLFMKLNHLPIQRGRVDIAQNVLSMTYPLKPRSHKSHVSGTLTLKLLYYNDPLPQSQSRYNNNILADVVPGATGHSSVQSHQSESSMREISSPTMLEDEEEEPLPRGWEARQDANGRSFYVDHANRRTQWERPTHAINTRGISAELELDRRRQMERTLARRNPALDRSSRTSSVASLNVVGVCSENVIRNSTSATSSLQPLSRSTQSRSHPQIYPTPINKSPVASELPPGWEKRTTSNERTFYINHNTRTTQWNLPTLEQFQQAQGTSQRLSVTLATPPLSLHGGSTSAQAYSDSHLGPLPTGWEKRQTANGKFFFIDHETKSTQWEDPRILKMKHAAAAAVPYSRDYKLKYENFRKQLAAQKPDNLPKMIEIAIRRNDIFEGSHRVIMSCKNRDHLKTRLWVKFEGEVGLDYGGVSREWFFLLSHEMFNPYYGLFEYAASDNYTLQINPDSGRCNEHHLEYFRFVGRILAMAIYHQRLIDGYFIRPMYKMMLEKKLALSDMESVDTEFYNSVKYILDNDPEPLCLTFTAGREFLGKIEEVDLKPGGADIEVTETNKREYVRLLVKWRFADRISKQMEHIKKGFNDVFPLKMLQIFDERELEYLLCGIGEIDIKDWKKNSICANGYTQESSPVIWFWKAVENFDGEMRARLLQFITGTSRVPMNGFAELQGSNGPQKFCIKKLGEPNSLPRAHTCFNRLDLPPYTSYHDLKEKLRVAIENCEGFEGVD